MENIRLKNVNLLEDIELAKNVIDGIIINHSLVFNNHSSVYRISNETISGPNYFGRMLGRKKVLSVTGSGDQIINSILAGAEDIKSFDISTFPKYYIALKIAAIKALNEDEFIDFIAGDSYINRYPFDKKYYDKIREYLDDDTRSFWDSIMNSYDQEKIYYSKLFSNFDLPKRRIIRNNPYLQGDNFELVKKRINDVNIELDEGNLFSMDMSKIDLVDLALLTNLINYIDRDSFDMEGKVKKYKAFLERLPLEENGIALTYNFIYDGSTDGLFQDKNYRVSKIDEEINGVQLENELIEYEKAKKLSLSFFRRK